MKKTIRIAKNGYVMMSLMLMILGVFIVFRPIKSVELFCDLIGIIFVTFGVIKIVGYISRDLYRLAFQYDMAFGILSVVVGFVMIFHSQGLFRFVNIVVGITFLMDGLLKIQLSKDARQFGVERWWSILFLAIITAALGTFLIVSPIGAIKSITIILGLAFIAEALLNICVVFQTTETLRQPR